MDDNSSQSIPAASTVLPTPTPIRISGVPGGVAREQGAALSTPIPATGMLAASSVPAAGDTAPPTPNPISISGVPGGVAREQGAALSTPIPATGMLVASSAPAADETPAVSRKPVSPFERTATSSSAPPGAPGPPSARRQKKPSAGENSGGPKKRGSKGDFHGGREEFLLSKLEEYATASKARQLAAFWAALWADYWPRFHWTLALDEEPTDPAPVDGALSHVEAERKAKVIRDTKQKIKTWFNHKRTALGVAANPWAPWLARLRRSPDKAPKRIPDYQYYMQHEAFKDKVRALFDERWWEV
ncbi:hypothetical protein B0H15DRAFT_801655 [Mycena belliarum]|uniref:Uncharacterized protein n=1 Tax=Mycena belliarum TaxID=1033014 RepID=A0AAD6U2F9_9AGAR|nr:hypothetical protein B0H15DRAFT_801655 [Mycena belliae]